MGKSVLLRRYPPPLLLTTDSSSFPFLLSHSRSYLNDVWKSPDGITWTQVCENGQVEWAPRRGFSAVVYEDKIYVVGGDTGVGVATDVWASKDGHLWELVWSDKPCCSRIGHSVVVHK